MSADAPAGAPPPASQPLQDAVRRFAPAIVSVVSQPGSDSGGAKHKKDRGIVPMGMLPPVVAAETEVPPATLAIDLLGPARLSGSRRLIPTSKL